MSAAKTFRDVVVSPVLEHLSRYDLRLQSVQAQRLLCGTALVESGLMYYQQVGGPAVSLFQIEPMTFDDVYGRYLPIQRTDLWAAVNELLIPGLGVGAPIKQLAGNTLFACAIARIRYWMETKPLPPESDGVMGLAHYWKDHYNSAAGAGDVEKFVRLYNKHLG